MFALLKFIFLTVPKTALWIFPGLFGLVWNPFKISLKKALDTKMYIYSIESSDWSEKLKKKDLKRFIKILGLKKGYNHPIKGSVVDKFIPEWLMRRLYRYTLDEADFLECEYESLTVVSKVSIDIEDLQSEMSACRVNCQGSLDRRHLLAEFASKMSEGLIGNLKESKYLSKIKECYSDFEGPHVPLLIDNSLKCRLCGKESDPKSLKYSNKAHLKFIEDYYKREVA